MTSWRCVLEVETEGFSEGLYRKELNSLERIRSPPCSDPSGQ